MIPKVDFRSLIQNRVDPRTILANAQAAATREEDKAGKTFLRTVTKRRMAGIKRAAELLDHLPGPGESLHAVLAGYFDALNLTLALLDNAATFCTHLRIATLAISKRNVSELAGLLDAKTVGSVSVLTSDFQKKHDPEIFAELVSQMGGRGQRVAAGRSHCKLMLVALADGRRYVFEGSANTRTARCAEQFCLSQDAALHDFYAQWFDDTVTTNEADTSRGETAG